MLTCKKCGEQFPRREKGSGSQRTVCDACKAPKQYDHVCVVCEAEFKSGKKNQLTCSPECYKVHDKAKTYSWRQKNPERYRELCRKHNKAAYERRKPVVTLKCAICETEFIKKSRSHRTCSDECSAELRRRRQREQKRAKRQSS